MTPRRPVRSLLVALALAPGLALTPAAPGSAAQAYPPVVQLPSNFSPEGIAGTGKGDVFYAGSRPGPAGGAVYRGDLRTGKGKVIVPPLPEGASIGMKYDPATGLLWVAGGGTGAVTAYDGRSGKQVARYTVAPGALPRFLNDVDITPDGVFVTDSQNAELVVVRTSGGALPARAELLPLTGDWDQDAGTGDRPANNANGIRALPDGDLLVVDQGVLLRVDPTTGVADALDQTGGRDLTGGDGLELDGDRLFVVYGFGEDSVAVVDLDLARDTYAVTSTLTKTVPVEDDLQRPTTAYFDGTYLWTVNGKFGVTTTDQEVVRLTP